MQTLRVLQDQSVRLIGELVLFTIKTASAFKVNLPHCHLPSKTLFSRSKYKMLLLPGNPISELILLNYSELINIVAIQVQVK